MARAIAASGVMRQTQHELEVLHRLPGCALAQVVEDGANDGLLSGLVGKDVNRELVRAVELFGVEREPAEEFVRLSRCTLPQRGDVDALLSPTAVVVGGQRLMQVCGSR